MDGKTLTLDGSAAVIGGIYVSEATHGIVANGNTIHFSVAKTSASSAPPPQSMPASSSSSSAAASVSSQGGAAARATGIVGGMGAAVGVVVGAFVL